MMNKPKKQLLKNISFFVPSRRSSSQIIQQAFKVNFLFFLNFTFGACSEKRQPTLVSSLNTLCKQTTVARENLRNEISKIKTQGLFLNSQTHTLIVLKMNYDLIIFYFKLFHQFFILYCFMIFKKIRYKIINFLKPELHDLVFKTVSEQHFTIVMCYIPFCYSMFYLFVFSYVNSHKIFWDHFYY